MTAYEQMRKEVSAEREYRKALKSEVSKEQLRIRTKNYQMAESVRQAERTLMQAKNLNFLGVQTIARQNSAMRESQYRQ